MINITEKLLNIYNRDGWRCQYQDCNEMATEIAHRIAKSKSNKKYIRDYAVKNYNLVLSKSDVEKIIHHEKNLVASCKKHNDYFNIGFKKMKRDSLISEIIEKEFKKLLTE